MSKKDRPFLESTIMNLLAFLDFEPRKCFRLPTPWGLYGADVVYGCAWWKAASAGCVQIRLDPPPPASNTQIKWKTR